MISFVVRTYLNDYNAKRGESLRVHRSLTDCADLGDARDVCEALKGVRETELCIRFALGYSSKETVILPLDALERAHELLNASHTAVVYDDASKAAG